MFDPRPWRAAVTILAATAMFACSSDDGLSVGPDREADVVVCLDEALSRDEAGAFGRRVLAGDFGEPPITAYTAQSSDAFTVNWHSSATSEAQREFIETLRRQSEVVMVVEDSSVNAECR